MELLPHHCTRKGIKRPGDLEQDAFRCKCQPSTLRYNVLLFWCKVALFGNKPTVDVLVKSCCSGAKLPCFATCQTVDEMVESCYSGANLPCFATCQRSMRWCKNAVWCKHVRTRRFGARCQQCHEARTHRSGLSAAEGGEGDVTRWSSSV
eukprot:jgi/Botrbrau1/5245/Bobra.0172s0107.1